MEILKVCTKCKMEKRTTEFPKDRSNKSGFFSWCKMCHNIKEKEFRQKYSRQETRDVKEKKVCSCCKKEKNILEYSKNRCCKDGFAPGCKDCAYKYHNAYSKARKQYDPKFKLLENMRSRLNKVLKSTSKSLTTRQLIGVNFETFTKWIEYQFEEGMTMDNYGSAWCHDHVLPISSFNLLDEEELHKAMNWMNIRHCTPLYNIKKLNKITQCLYVI